MEQTSTLFGEVHLSDDCPSLEMDLDFDSFLAGDLDLEFSLLGVLDFVLPHLGDFDFER